MVTSTLQPVSFFSLWAIKLPRCPSPPLSLSKIWLSLSCSLQTSVTTFSLLRNHLPPLISVLSHLLLVICQCFVLHLCISARTHPQYITLQPFYLHSVCIACRTLLCERQGDSWWCEIKLYLYRTATCAILSMTKTGCTQHRSDAVYSQ